MYPSTVVLSFAHTDFIVFGLLVSAFFITILTIIRIKKRTPDKSESFFDEFNDTNN